MTPYMTNGLSVSTENLGFSLPVGLFSVNILVCRINYKSAAEALG